MPVAIGGLFWFALVAAIAAFGRVGKGQPAGSYIFALSIVGMAAVLYLGHASYNMKTFCILCMGTYVSVIGIFLTSGASPSIPILQVPARMFSDLVSALKKPDRRRCRAGDCCSDCVGDGVFSEGRHTPQLSAKPIESTADFCDAVVQAAPYRSRHPGRRRQSDHREVQ